MKKINFKKVGMRAVGVAAGGATSAFINKFVPAMDPKFRALIKMGAGILLPEFASKSAILNDAGIALAGAGAAELTNTLINKGSGVQGIGNEPEYKVEGNEYVIEGNGNDALEGNNALGNSGNDALGELDNKF